jgi:hypothetical protein
MVGPNIATFSLHVVPMVREPTKCALTCVNLAAPHGVP